MKVCRSIVVLLMAAGLTGCATFGDRGYVQREWSMTLRELGISPVFPPREDVVVGDIYAFDYDPNSADTRRLFETKWRRLSLEDRQMRISLGMSPRLARLAKELEEIIQQEYHGTLSAPATTAEYNSIVGNPALAAAIDQVEGAETKLKKLRDKVTAAKAEFSTAQKKLVDATREKQDKDTAVKIAEEKLNTAKSTLPDTIAQEEKLKAARTDLRLKEDAVTKARRALADADAETDPVKKEPAQKEVTQAERNKEDAEVAVRRAHEDLEAAKLVKLDVSSFESDLASAKNNQQAADDTVTKLRRISDDKSAVATAIEQEQAGPIEKAMKEVAVAQAIRDAIATAGAKMLYHQPRDAKRNVYTGADLPNPNGGPDDLVNSRVNRLRLVAFPEFATTTFTQGDLAALVPIEAMMVGLNISSTNVAKVAIKVPAAESYAVSLINVIDKIADHNTSQDIWTIKANLNKAGLFQYYNVNKPGSDNQKNIYFQVLTEVFYARTMDITLFSAGSFGARMQVGPPAPAAGAVEESAALQTPVASIDSSASASAPMLTSIQNRLALTQTVPGGSVQVVSYSDQSIGLRRVFDRPVAIGARGIVLAVNKNQVVRVSIKGESVPLAIPPPPQW